MLLNLGICAALFAIPAVAHADTISIFSNLGPGSSYNTMLGNPVGDGLDGSGFNYAQGDTFLASQTATVDLVAIALSCAVCPAGGSITLNLTQDVAGHPEAVLESFSILGSNLGTLGTNNPLIVVSSLLHPSLSAGTRYWVTVSGLPTSAIAWNWNNTGDVSAEAISVDGGASWFSPSGITPGAYAVNGTPIPEPSALWLLTTGVLSLGIAQLRLFKRKPKGAASTSQT
jgi:hypothetical protein